MPKNNQENTSPCNRDMEKAIDRDLVSEQLAIQITSKQDQVTELKKLWSATWAKYHDNRQSQSSRIRRSPPTLNDVEASQRRYDVALGELNSLRQEFDSLNSRGLTGYANVTTFKAVAGAPAPTVKQNLGTYDASDLAFLAGKPNPL